MAVQGDTYRLRAAEMHVKAERNEFFREEFENLMLLYLRLAEEADRNEPERQQRPNDKAED
jgi:hypothetical protein